MSQTHRAVERKLCQALVTITATFSNPLTTRGRGATVRRFVKLQGVTGCHEGIAGNRPIRFWHPGGLDPPVEHRDVHLVVKDERTNEVETIWLEAYDGKGSKTDRPGIRCSLNDRRFDIETLPLLVDFSTAVPGPGVIVVWRSYPLCVRTTLLFVRGA